MPGTELTAVVLLTVGIVATATDLRRAIIPNWLLATAALALVSAAVASGHVLSSVLGAGLLSVVAALGVATGGLGMGDLKYMAVVGLALGPLAGLLALFLAALGAVAWHLPSALRHGAAVRFPFGPFIALGSVCAPLIWSGPTR